MELAVYLLPCVVMVMDSWRWKPLILSLEGRCFVSVSKLMETNGFEDP